MNKAKEFFFGNKRATVETIICIVLLIAVIISSAFLIKELTSDNNMPDLDDNDINDHKKPNLDGKYSDEDDLTRKLHLLKDSVFYDNTLEDTIRDNCGNCSSENPFVVFFSVCDKIQRANVIHANGSTLESAWANAEALLRAFISDKNYDPAWLKVDVVKATEAITVGELRSRVSHFYDEMYRCGISLDNNFDNAFIEAEINGNKLLDYELNVLDLPTINKYLKSFDRNEISGIPEDLIVFSCYGWFCDENYDVYRLFSDTYNYGRRVLETIDKNVSLGVVQSASEYLSRLLQSNGKFIYGYYPTYDKELTDYNILRHAGTIWSLICQYKLTGDETMPDKIRSSIGYLLEDYSEGGFLKWKDPETAFIVERKSNEIKLGGNAIAIISLTEYIDVFGEDEFYKKVIIALGEGILTMQDASSGEYVHIADPSDYTVRERYRTVYYDGEATFALSRLYAMTLDSKWIEAAEKAVEMFIRNDYYKYADHWVAYSLNELTMYEKDPEKLERYYSFALRNAQENLNTIINQKTTYHTYMELLMATFEVYTRIQESGFELDYMSEFDEKLFLDTIFRRADYMLNGYCYPEYIMYLKNPARIAGGFFVRHDGYRIRIDDVQHFVGGYYKYYTWYDKLISYYNEINK